jgi:hypothetical protein
VSHVASLCSNVFLASALVASTQVVAQQAETAQSPRGQALVTPQRLMRVAGVIKDESGQPATGSMSVTLSLYKEEQGGAPLWAETQNITVDSAGHYITFLGVNSKGDVPMNLFTSGDIRWLGVKADNRVEQPRILLGVPYMLKAGEEKNSGASAVVPPAPNMAPRGRVDY